MSETSQALTIAHLLSAVLDGRDVLIPASSGPQAVLEPSGTLTLVSLAGIIYQETNMLTFPVITEVVPGWPDDDFVVTIFPGSSDLRTRYFCHGEAIRRLCSVTGCHSELVEICADVLAHQVCSAHFDAGTMMGMLRDPGGDSTGEEWEDYRSRAVFGWRLRQLYDKAARQQERGARCRKLLLRTARDRGMTLEQVAEHLHELWADYDLAQVIGFLRPQWQEIAPTTCHGCGLPLDSRRRCRECGDRL